MSDKSEKPLVDPSYDSSLGLNFVKCNSFYATSSPPAVTADPSIMIFLMTASAVVSFTFDISSPSRVDCRDVICFKEVSSYYLFASD